MCYMFIKYLLKLFTRAFLSLKRGLLQMWNLRSMIGSLSEKKGVVSQESCVLHFQWSFLILLYHDWCLERGNSVYSRKLYVTSNWFIQQKHTKVEFVPVIKFLSSDWFSQLASHTARNQKYKKVRRNCLWKMKTEVLLVCSFPYLSIYLRCLQKSTCS